MKTQLVAKMIGLVMNKKVRMAVKIIGMLMWIGEKGIDIYEEFADQVDTKIYIGDEAKKAAKTEVRKEIARVMRSNGAQEEKIKEFLKSVEA